MVVLQLAFTRSFALRYASLERRGFYVYKAPRGTTDILPAEQGYYRHVEETAARLCQRYGYERIDTPVFEDARLFVRTIGAGTDIVEKETYTFDDRSGQAMTLRPEGTAPICRAYIEHGMRTLPQPVRLFYLASLFRYERPQKGRYREHQQGSGSAKLGFRYLPKMAGDTSNSGWFVMQLKSAKVAGLHVDPASFEGIMKFYKSCEKPAAGIQKEDDSYDKGNYRFGYQPNTPHGVNNTSIGVLAHLFTGTKPEEVVGAAKWLLRTNPPAWRADLGPAFNGIPFPMYYSYYTTLNMFQIGGDLWKQWNKGLKAMLLPNQRRDGDFDGSWDPLAEYEKKAGRAYTTAIGAMCLEVYYRYLPMYRE